MCERIRHASVTHPPIDLDHLSTLHSHKGLAGHLQWQLALLLRYPHKRGSAVYCPRLRRSNFSTRKSHCLNSFTIRVSFVLLLIFNYFLFNNRCLSIITVVNNMLEREPLRIWLENTESIMWQDGLDNVEKCFVETLPGMKRITQQEKWLATRFNLVIKMSETASNWKLK